ncbi:MAG: SUMF1/EgtB/PvdO family nonheme iron enzyme [Myxococcota bacterium]
MDPRELRQIGPYRVRRLIDEGGMSWVFEVEDPTFAGVHRALKMLKPKASTALEYRRFEAEANLLARLEHPNLVTIYDYAVDEATGHYYYTMTLVDGPPLSRRPLLPPQQAAAIFLDVLAGLAKLHELGVIHRDIKPSNILVTSDGRAVLIDLGIIRVADQPHQTAAGVAIGTVLYMSPEQAQGATVGPESDIFSLGLSLYEVLTGANIYESIDSVDTTSGESVLMYLGALVHQRQQLDMQLSDARYAPLRDVVEKACRMDPAQRYPSAQVMREELLDRYERMRAQDRTLPAVEIGGASEASRTPQSQKPALTTAFWLGSVLTLVLAGLVTGWWLGRDESGLDSVTPSPEPVFPREISDAGRDPDELPSQQIPTTSHAEPAPPDEPILPPVDAVLVSAGPFWMGCTRETDRLCGEKTSRRRIFLPEFRIDRTEVTLAAYERCIDAGACSGPGPSADCNTGHADRATHPVNCVSWHDARDYCRWSGSQLPSEAQWEKAARGVDGRVYPWGEAPPSCDRAVVGNPDPGARDGCGRDGTWPAGSHPKGHSPYGAQDMAGNVGEWTQEQTVRGGDWLFPPEHARSAASVEANPDRRKPNYGFRCVR